MRILAIDPGTTQSAWLILESPNTIVEFGKLPNNQIGFVIKNADYNVLAIEMIASYGMPVGKEIFETCLWIGRYMQLAEDRDHPVKLVYRKDIKIALCGTNKAKDANVRQALIDIFGKQGTKKNKGKTYGITNDVWSALAIAVYYNRSR